MKKVLTELASIARFVGKTIYHFFSSFEARELVRQCYVVGYRSFFLISFTAFIAGVVFTKQSRPSLASFGAESWLPSLVSQAFFRSLGPLLSGFICAGKLGFNFGAELG